MHITSGCSFTSSRSAENTFLPVEFRNGSDPTAFGNVARELARFLQIGIDGFFKDQPTLGVQARDAFVGAR